MAVTLRLKRFGRLNHPTYRVVATDPRFPRDGRIIESLGYYLPLMPREQEQLKRAKSKGKPAAFKPPKKKVRKPKAQKRAEKAAREAADSKKK